MFSVLALSLVLRIVATIIHVSVVRVSFAEANVYRNSSAYLLRKMLYEVGSRRTAVFIEINGGNSHYIYYFRFIFPLAFIYLLIYVLSFVFFFTKRLSVSSSISLSCAALTFSFSPLSFLGFLFFLSLIYSFNPSF